MSELACTDRVALDLWHVIAPLEELSAQEIGTTRLLEEGVAFTLAEGQQPVAWRHQGGGAPQMPANQTDRMPVLCRYGYLWTSLGKPAADVFAIPEYQEADRRNIHAATFGVNVSAPRGIENFLDMGHFPYVHTDILGVEPHTEVKEYFVEVSAERDEILATNCKFYQPKAGAAAKGGADVEYIYRVPHPYCSVLYKSSAIDADRMDVIAIFLQPVDQERVRAHMLLSLLDDENDDTGIRLFQQTIFGQDKPILENQYPKRLPLDPRAETPIRADKSAIAYRRWLSAKGLTYGVIPATS